jgi:hypothetical protein
MRFTEKQYLEIIARQELRKLPAPDFSKLEQDKKERAKFRKHIRGGEYEFCDSCMMEGQGNEKTI